MPASRVMDVISPTFGTALQHGGRRVCNFGLKKPSVASKKSSTGFPGGSLEDQNSKRHVGNSDHEVLGVRMGSSRDWARVQSFA